MASGFGLKNLAIFMAIAISLFVDGTLAGEITCEKLEQGTCAFAISSTGKRCVLEKHVKRSGEEAYTCRTSEIEADKLRNWIETDECIKSCGVDRKTLGISSDSLLESSFTQKLCSPQCYHSCPNIVDLYFNLAAGEDKGNAHRKMSEMRSSGFVAPGPLLPAKFMSEETMAPSMAPGPLLPAKFMSGEMMAPSMAPTMAPY